MLIVERELTKQEKLKMKKIKAGIKKNERELKKVMATVQRLKDKRDALFDEMDELFEDVITKHSALETDRIVIDLKAGVIFINEECFIGGESNDH
jgi:uncharacterized protein YoxC